jgi:hypothetical protein
MSFFNQTPSTKTGAVQHQITEIRAELLDEDGMATKRVNGHT